MLSWCIVFYSVKLFICLFSPPFLLCFLCLLIGVLIITSRIVPQALLYAQMSHTEPLFSSLAD